MQVDTLVKLIQIQPDLITKCNSSSMRQKTLSRNLSSEVSAGWWT